MISVWVYLQKQHANPNPESKFAKKRPKLNGLKDMDILLMVPVMYSGMIRRIALGLSESRSNALVQCSCIAGRRNTWALNPALDTRAWYMYIANWPTLADM